VIDLRNNWESRDPDHGPIAQFHLYLNPINYWGGRAADDPSSPLNTLASIYRAKQGRLMDGQIDRQTGRIAIKNIWRSF